MPSVEIVNSYGSFLKLEPHWNNLLEKSGNSNIFLTFEWLSIWWECFGEGKKLFILLAMEGKKIIGLAPLMITKKNIFFLNSKAIEFIGAPVSDFQDFIILERNYEVLTSFVNTILNYSYLWDYFHIRSIIGDSENLTILRQVIPERDLSFNIKEAYIVYYLPLADTWQEQKMGFKKKVRKNARRKLRRLKEEGELEFFIIDDCHEVGKYLMLLFELRKKVAVKKDKTQKGFYSERRLSFLRLVGKRFIEKGFLRFSGLRLNGQVIALKYSLCYDGIYYAYMSGYDSAYKSYSPSTLLNHKVMEDLCGRGIKEFNFLIGKETYKRDWTELYRETYKLYTAKGTVYGRVLLFWLTAFRPFLKGLLPKMFRRPLSQ